MPNQYSTTAHRPRLATQVLVALRAAGAPLHVFDLCRALNAHPVSLYAVCGRLVQRGVVQRTAPGTYALPREG